MPPTVEAESLIISINSELFVECALRSHSRKREFDHKSSQAIGSASLSFNFQQSFPLSHTARFMVQKFSQIMIQSTV
ncbi:hypothetical protein WA1_49520 [Scytonema hofmannii PCC 7110]|uniref:Uncharacterized protein n=1 Tax=Scytonema hofmannii PCC 7110 TaxID=128403 RepID=A0A139WQS5_9CYAN|nr:hypothetical protein WA1_49520 [Scytonema hofmannii PCC 7110]